MGAASQLDFNSATNIYIIMRLFGDEDLHPAGCSSAGGGAHLSVCYLCDSHTQPDIDSRFPESLQSAGLQAACEGVQDGLTALQQRHLHPDMH